MDDSQSSKLPRQVAVALHYDLDNDPAPAVIAKGRGQVAERILDLAREHNIPIQQDTGLADALVRLDLGDMIPPELFPAVAEILAFIYKMNARI